MAGTPEIPQSEPQIQERKEEFIVDETLQKAGFQPVVKTFKAQVNDDKGQPLIQTPPAQVITVQPPAPPDALAAWAKGPISRSLTWLGAFWVRTWKKALHFGWKIISG
jgi:hypothetical protein